MANLLTPAQVAEKLRITDKTLAVWRCTGRYDLPFIKIGRKVVYDQHDVDAFIESRKVSTS